MRTYSLLVERHSFGEVPEGCLVVHPGVKEVGSGWSEGTRRRSTSAQVVSRHHASTSASASPFAPGYSSMKRSDPGSSTAYSERPSKRAHPDTPALPDPLPNNPLSLARGKVPRTTNIACWNVNGLTSANSAKHKARPSLQRRGFRSSLAVWLPPLCRSGGRRRPRCNRGLAP